MTIDLDDFDADFEALEADFIGKESLRTIDSNPEKVYKIPLCLQAGISNDAYHKSKGISSSQLKPALKSMHLYHESYEGRVPFKETEAMKLGTAVHKLTLEALDFPSEIAVSKKFGLTKRDRQERDEFYAANKGKVVITHEQYDKCRRMRDSLMSLDEIKYIFQDGEPELSGYYKDIAPARNESTYMLCKYRPDWRTDWCIADIKSTVDASAEAFSKTINNFEHHLSAAHYLEGDRILKGTDHRQFLFLCVEPEYPHEAAIYRLGRESLEFGELLRRKILTQIKQGRETKTWPRLNDGISQEIEIPPYALNKLREMKI